MLRNLLEEEKARINQIAQNHKESAKYIVNFIEENPKKYLEAFNNNKIPKEGMPEHIYSSVVETINRMSREYTETIGTKFSTQPKPNQDHLPATKLGWLEYVVTKTKDKDYETSKYFKHEWRPSKEGFKIINELRDIMELKSLNERKKEVIREINRKKPKSF